MKATTKAVAKRGSKRARVPRAIGPKLGHLTHISNNLTELGINTFSNNGYQLG
jgi:hypothetical protein